MWLGFKGLKQVITYSHDRAFILAFLGYMVVGLGSMAFHATLKYSMQLADELPMIYTVCITSYIAFSYGKSPKVKALVAAGLTAIACFITVYYLYAKDPVFHQVAYGFITLSSTIRGFYVTEVDVKSALRRRVPAEADERMRQIRTLAISGILMFLAGFFVWNMDNIFCHSLVHARNHIKLPWSIVLEGHGWWHILTGLDGKEKEFMLDWTPLRSIPQVVPSQGATQKKTQ